MITPEIAAQFKASRESFARDPAPRPSPAAPISLPALAAVIDRMTEEAKVEPPPRAVAPVPMPIVETRPVVEAVQVAPPRRGPLRLKLDLERVVEVLESSHSRIGTRAYLQSVTGIEDIDFILGKLLHSGCVIRLGYEDDAQYALVETSQS